MNKPCFSWRVRSGEQEKLLPLIDLMEQGLDLMKIHENGEVVLSYHPDENLFRFTVVVPGQQPSTLILLCDFDPWSSEGL